VCLCVNQFLQCGSTLPHSSARRRELSLAASWWRVAVVVIRRNVKRFRGGLVFEAHRLLYHSTLGLRVMKKKKKKKEGGGGWGPAESKNNHSSGGELSSGGEEIPPSQVATLGVRNTSVNVSAKKDVWNRVSPPPGAAVLG